MKTFKIIAKNDGKADEIREKVETHGFRHSDDPDFMISYGGDGTFLYAERNHPGIPKLLVRDSMVCFKCDHESFDEVLEHIKKDEHEVNEHFKIEVEAGGGKMEAVNDVVIRNKNPTKALRFRVSVDGEEFNDVIIGDGIVVSTPFGSTGYYYSIARKNFEGGMGVAFSNPTEEVNPIRVPESSTVELEVVRGKAQVAADNIERIVEIGEGERAKIRKSSGVARILTCPS